jgi:hypothetical protein
MAQRTQATVRINKQPPRRLRITHSFPEPRPDDGERFVGLVRRLLKMGEEKK